MKPPPIEVREKNVYCAVHGEFGQHLLLPLGDPEIPRKWVGLHKQSISDGVQKNVFRVTLYTYIYIGRPYSGMLPNRS